MLIHHFIRLPNAFGMDPHRSRHNPEYPNQPWIISPNPSSFCTFLVSPRTPMPPFPALHPLPDSSGEDLGGPSPPEPLGSEALEILRILVRFTSGLPGAGREGAESSLGGSWAERRLRFSIFSSELRAAINKAGESHAARYPPPLHPGQRWKEAAGRDLSSPGGVCVCRGGDFWW